MYRYNVEDTRLVHERVAQFQGQVQRFLAGQLSEDEFRPLRLMNGLYMQRHAYMLRVAIPYGLLSSTQLRMLGHIARRYDRDYGHFTTRQNIQYNWIKLEEVPDILADLARVEMHAMQTSGNCVRNITSDPFAGIAPDEELDPRPYCEIIRQWSTLHPEFSFLPRKFKIAVTAAKNDRTAVFYHDIGLRVLKNAAGEVGFEVIVGGGMGRTPVIGQVLHSFLPEADLLSYLEAILRVYNELGRRDNIYKARIKILVRHEGTEEFKQMVETEWAQAKPFAPVVTAAQVVEMQNFFTAPAYNADAALDESFAEKVQSNPLFAQWVKHCVHPHKVAGYKAVSVSLKAPQVAPGDATAAQMEAVADLADRYSFGQIRTTYHQNLVLSDVAQGDVYALWQALRGLNLATPNVDTLADIVCCPGLDFCSLANASSIPVAQQIIDRFSDLDYLYDLGDIRLNISGCVNACGHHHVGNIGILGVDKKGQEFYQLMLGGSADFAPTLADNMGPAIAKAEVPVAIEKIVQVYVEQRDEGEPFIDTYRRIGMEPFRERVYAAH